jgi:hypothetical protein
VRYLCAVVVDECIRYETGRSWSLLKVKTFHDAEAKVINHEVGQGQFGDRMGALEVRLPPLMPCCVYACDRSSARGRLDAVLCNRGVCVCGCDELRRSACCPTVALSKWARDSATQSARSRPPSAVSSRSSTRSCRRAASRASQCSFVFDPMPSGRLHRDGRQSTIAAMIDIIYSSRMHYRPNCVGRCRHCDDSWMAMSMAMTSSPQPQRHRTSRFGHSRSL